MGVTEVTKFKKNNYLSKSAGKIAALILKGFF